MAPSLLEVFSSWDQLRHLEPGWFMLVALFQLATFGSLWAVQRLVLRTSAWRPVITSQLAGNAASRLVPGGAAAGTAVQYRLLRSAGIDPDTATSGMTAAGLLQLAATLALPAVALPGALLGGPAPEGLLRVAVAGGALFAVLFVLVAAALADDHLLSWLGRLVDTIRRRLPITGRRRGTAPSRPLAPRLLIERDALLEGLDQRWSRATALAVSRVVFDYLSLLTAIAAFGAEGRLSLVLLAYASAAILGMVPLTPGGLGFVEAGLTGTLTLAGVPASEAVGVALLYRLFSFWLPIPFGLAAGVIHRATWSPDRG